MAGGKETPRQRMIGILYLVLLGLIALEAPETLLDAFKNIRDSLTASKVIVTSSINTTIKAFAASKLKEQPERAQPIYDRALKAKAYADAFDKYVDSLETILGEAGGGINADTKDYNGRENVDASVHLMVADDGPKQGYVLEKKINALRENLMSLLQDKEKVGVDLPLHTVAPVHVAGFDDKDWEQSNFGEGLAMTAAMTQLVKIQTDAKNAENEVVKKILIEADEAKVNFDKFAAVAIAPSSYVLLGQPYTADVFLTAYDSQLSPKITVGGSTLNVAEGKGKYTGSTSSEGLHTWAADIDLKDNDGKITSYKTEPVTYMVAKPSAVVSPDKMNVLYIGVPNPVSVSAPGVALKDLHVSMEGGSISPVSEGKYTIKVMTIGAASVTVAGEISKGKSVVLGKSPFRVKAIPDPKAQYAGKSGGNTSAANLRGQDYVYAVLKDFDFDAKFNVTRFTLLIAKPRQDVIQLSASSGQLSGAMHSAMNIVTPGTTVVFKDIIAVGPDGRQRGLDPIVISAN
jgi:gliding motility-associated protein GldM